MITGMILIGLFAVLSYAAYLSIKNAQNVYDEEMEL